MDTTKELYDAITDRQWTLAEIRASNQRAGQYWFHTDTQRYHRSADYEVIQGEAGVFIVYSDNIEGEPKRWKLARFDPFKSTVRIVERPVNLKNTQESVRAYASKLASGEGDTHQKEGGNNG